VSITTNARLPARRLDSSSTSSGPDLHDADHLGQLGRDQRGIPQLAQ
jgi:hypothetical protein